MPLPDKKKATAAPWERRGNMVYARRKGQGKSLFLGTFEKAADAEMAAAAPELSKLLFRLSELSFDGDRTEFNDVRYEAQQLIADLGDRLRSIKEA